MPDIPSFIGGKKYILHLIPSGILRRGKVCVIGNGVVIDPLALVAEIEGLRKLGVKIGKNLLISDCAHLVLPYHRAARRTTRAAERPRENRNDQARHRPGLRRQGRAHRPAHVRSDAAEFVLEKIAGQDSREQQHPARARRQADQLSRK